MRHLFSRGSATILHALWCFYPNLLLSRELVRDPSLSSDFSVPQLRLLDGAYYDYDSEQYETFTDFDDWYGFCYSKLNDHNDESHVDGNGVGLCVPDGCPECRKNRGFFEDFVDFGEDHGDKYFERCDDCDRVVEFNETFNFLGKSYNKLFIN